MVSCLLNFRPVVRFSVFGSKCISWRKIFVFIMCLKLFFLGKTKFREKCPSGYMGLGRGTKKLKATGL